MEEAKQEPNYPHKSFEHVIVAVDLVLFTVVEDELKVLLLELKEAPFSGNWALPGGLVKLDESLDEAARRHLEQKAGVSGVFLEQLYTFGAVNRDPRGRVVSVAYFALVPNGQIKPHTSDRYNRINWQATKKLPEMAYDHTGIIEVALDRLRNKLGYTNIVYSLLPAEFTLSDLQKVYEIILDKSLDKRNFRKKILSIGILKELAKKTSGRPSRPAALYEFSKKQPEVVGIL